MTHSAGSAVLEARPVRKTGRLAVVEMLVQARASRPLLRGERETHTGAAVVLAIRPDVRLAAFRRVWAVAGNP